MKRILSALLTLATAAALVPAVHAQCTNASLTGNYGLTFSGFNNDKGKKGNEVPFAGVGLGTFDGAGNVSASFTFSDYGVIGTSPYTGTYTVNSDCTGTVTATPGSGNANLSFVIVSGGAEVFAVNTLPGGTWTADFKKQ